MTQLWNGKRLFRLGKTLPEAYKVWAERLAVTDKANNIGQLLDRYAIEVVPTKKPKTQRGNVQYIGRLRGVFGTVPLKGLKPQHVYQYVDKRKAKATARKEIAVLSHAFTKAVEWGYIDKHPFKGEVRLAGDKPRTRYVEDWEITECFTLNSKMKRGSINAIQAYIRLKLLTGLRRSDLLRLRIVQLTEDGIHVSTSKNDKAVIFEWSPELRQTVEDAKAARPVDISPWLFCNRKGQGYVDEKTGEAWGWDSMWQRFMERVLTETKVTERFTEHDLRAKAGSDADTVERAGELLTHADTRITERVYRRKPKRVKPLK
ncbi:MAG: tyrosine-type recombinase/integrase [Alphaproteobacteria bacterium]